jgi:hypothetical protein
VVCKNIKNLANAESPATTDEIRAAASQFVRKISGISIPRAPDEEAFSRAIKEITRASARLLDCLTTATPPEQR